MKHNVIVSILLTISYILPSNAIEFEELPSSCTMWVDSVIKTMDRHARVGQLFMPVAMSAPTNGWPEKIQSWVEQLKIGGIYFSSGDLFEQASATNRFQDIARNNKTVPLMVAADAEWGLSMRIPGTIVFPHNTMLGAISDTSLLVEYGQEMARQCHIMGIQVDFGPVADVNNNPDNPVINTRSFGSDAKEVSWRAAAFSQGVASGGVLPVAKHFPGHGNTSEDSHEQLAKVTNDRPGLDSTELYPFKYLIDNGLEGIMVGHLSVPALDSTTHLPSSQSPIIVNELLRKEMGFQGLCITDALAMKGAAASYSGVNCIRSLLAGNDILLKPVNLAGDIHAVEQAIEQGILTDEIIDEKCRRILSYKYVLGLTQYPHIDTVALMSRLHTPRAEALNRRLHEAAMTMLRNEDDYLPIRHMDTKKTAVLLLGQKEPKSRITKGGAPFADNPFARQILDYQENVDILYLTENSPLDKQTFSESLQNYDRIIVGVYANTPQQRNWLSRLRPVAKKLCLTFFTSPYTMAVHGDILSEAAAVVCAYENTVLAQEAAAEAIYGGIETGGHLPAPIGRYYAQGHGLYQAKTRLSYGWPEQEGLSSALISAVDTIMEEALTAEAFPGAQLLVARNGRIILNKTYGWVDAAHSRPVEPTDIYDLASLTKATVTVPAIMSLCESGKLLLDEPVSHHLPALRGTDKASLTYRQMLYHESRLAPFIAFYRNLIDTASYQCENFISFHKDSLHQDRFDESSWVPSHYSFNNLLCCEPRDSFTLKVAEQMYVHASFRDSVVRQICDSNLRRRKGYCYSDLGFLLMGFSVENLTGKTLDAWAEENLFAPLGAYTAIFQPLDRFPLQRIIPTALDTTLRHQMLQGYPHDEAAAFLGGVAGNAGLFSSANDMAKYLQMLLDCGTYGGHRYFEPSTVRFFTAKRSKYSRRMLGFDASEPNPLKIQTTSELAPKCTYGHTGYTGTNFWIDPENRLIIILLTNRLQPDRTNQIMLSTNVRTKLQDAIYKAMVE